MIAYIISLLCIQDYAPDSVMPRQRYARQRYAPLDYPIDYPIELPRNAFGGRMHSEAVCIPRQYAIKTEYNQARIQPSPNTTILHTFS